MSSSPPILYAELLPHIRQISVIASLHTPCDQSTKAELSPDGYRFTLHHGGAATILQLPGQVGVSSQLQEPLLGRRELSWRLPLATPLSQAGVEDVQSIASPWNAAALTPDAEFSCRGCGSLVVGKGTVKTWKDLPSENWAEMMDFWHCHKPDVPHTHTHGSSDHAAAVPDKGYGANTKFSAAIGVGFVDLTTFLLSDSDCTALQKPASLSSSSSPGPGASTSYEEVSCASCQQYLGHLDHQGEGIRLYKWRLCHSPPHLGPPTTTTMPSLLPQIISAQLLSIMQSQCTSRILLLPQPLQGNALSLWVFAPYLRFSSSLTSSSSSSSLSPALTNPSSGRSRGTPAMKIFFQSLPSLTSTSTTTTTATTTTIEELLLPAAAIAELEKALTQSGALLPPSARKFQVWQVGLLERYEGDGLV